MAASNAVLANDAAFLCVSFKWTLNRRHSSPVEINHDLILNLISGGNANEAWLWRLRGVSMADLEMLLGNVSQAPANTDFGTLVELMTLAGFELRMGKKQHAIFTNKAHGIRQTVAKPYHGPVKPVYVRECLKAIESLRVAQGKPDA